MNNLIREFKSRDSLECNPFSLSHLQLVVVCHGLQRLLSPSGQLGQLDVHGCPDGCAQVGGAEREEPEAVVVREGEGLLDLAHSVD